MPLVRLGARRGGAAARRGRGLIPDEAIRPALEAAVEVARAAAATNPSYRPAPALRPLLGMRRLPDRSLAAVRRALEADELLLQATAASTTEELVGRASWLYLQREDGWEEAVAAEVASEAAAADEAAAARASADAVRKLAAVEASLRRAQEEAARLRSAASDAKERLAEERKARRALESELGRLRQRVAALESAPAAAPPAPVAAPQPLPAPPAVVVPVDRAPVVAALDALDDARDALTSWLSAVPAAVASTASPPRPGPRRPAALPPAVVADTVDAADHLLRLPGCLVLVDGYNVTKLARPELDLDEQRRWLLDALVGLATRTGATFQAVFDGADDAPTAPAHGPRLAGVRVRFTAAGDEADDEVLRLVLDAPRSRPVVVVSGDQRVRSGAAELGANVVASSTLVDLLRR